MKQGAVWGPNAGRMASGPHTAPCFLRNGRLPFAYRYFTEQP